MSNPTKTTAVAKVEAPRIPYPMRAIHHGVDESQWSTLVNAVFPTAKTPEGVMLALSYCKARGLDVFKRPVHIVPMNTKIKGEDGRENWATIETVWPGINELRTTAHRTGLYAGCDPATFGADVDHEFDLGEDNDDHPNAPPSGKAKTRRTLKVRFPEWAQVTVYRMVGSNRVAFPGPRVWWLETYATAGRNTDLPNDMWRDRARGQLEKCAEAAALRKAFPEELGADYTIDEAPRQMRNVTPVEPEPAASRPDRTEIEAKPKATPKPKAEEVATVIEAKAEPEQAREVVVEAKAEEKPAEIGDALEHALSVLPKLSNDEINGARDSLRRELSSADFVTWNTAAMERQRGAKVRR